MPLDLHFEWDRNKNRANSAKHGVSFEEVLFVFNDTNELVKRDEDHSEDEERWISIGVKGARRAVVAYTYRGKAIRIISARRPTGAEMNEYWRNAR